MDDADKELGGRRSISSLLSSEKSGFRSYAKFQLHKKYDRLANIQAIAFGGGC
jgi:hypothetical protein